MPQLAGTVHVLPDLGAGAVFITAAHQVQNLAAEAGFHLDAAFTGVHQAPQLAGGVHVVPLVQPAAILNTGFHNVQHLAGGFIFDFIHSIARRQELPLLMIGSGCVPQLNGRPGFGAATLDLQHFTAGGHNAIVLINFDFYICHLDHSPLVLIIRKNWFRVNKYAVNLGDFAKLFSIFSAFMLTLPAPVNISPCVFR